MKIEIPEELAAEIDRLLTRKSDAQMRGEYEQMLEYQRRSRAAGAKKTNTMQSQAAADFWEPWIKAYRLYRSNGATRSEAIKQIMQDMENAGCPRSRSTTYERLID